MCAWGVWCMYRVLCAVHVLYLLYVPRVCHVCCVLFCVCAYCGRVWEVGVFWAGRAIVGVCIVCVSGSGCGWSLCGQLGRLMGTAP